MSGSEPRTGSVELHVTSNSSFLRGASHVEELFLAAQAMGYDALAITDWHSPAGIARARARAAGAGVRLVVGCRLPPLDNPPLAAFPFDQAGSTQSDGVRADASISSLLAPLPDGTWDGQADYRRVGSSPWP